MKTKKFDFLLTKNSNSQNWREARKHVGELLLEARRDRHLKIEDVAMATGFPEYFIDNLELGRACTHFGLLSMLTRFYGLKPKIWLDEAFTPEQMKSLINEDENQDSENFEENSTDDFAKGDADVE